MPAWLLQLIVTLAVQFGIPFVQKLFPKWVTPAVVEILQEFIQKLFQHKEEKKVLVEETKGKIAACYGSQCKGE